MARLPPIGVSYMAPDENEISLEQITANLGLAPMSPEQQNNIRLELGIAIGRWTTEHDPHAALQLKYLVAKFSSTTPEGGQPDKGVVKRLKSVVRDRERLRPLQRQDVVTDLESIARRLEASEKSLRGRQPGMRDARDIEVANAVTEILALNPQLADEVDEYLSDFCDRLAAIAHACRIAAADRKRIKDRPGRKQLGWYDAFTKLVLSVASQNRIKPTIGTNRVTGKPEGRFFELATEFERLLLRPMRADENAARAKRLQRSLKRLAAGQNRTRSKQR